MLMVKQCNGFTAIEAIIVIAIVSALILIAVPDLSSFVQTNRLRAAAEQFYSDMQFARSNALKNNSDVHVDLSTGSTWCYGLNQGSGCDCNTPGSCQIDGTDKTVASTNFSAVTMSATGFTGDTFYFESLRGTTAGSSGTVNFTIGSNTISVVLNAFGQVRICSSTASGYQPC